MNAEGELRDLVDERVRAVRARDSATLAARPTDDVISFDVLPPLNPRGSQATVDRLQRWRIVHDRQSEPFHPATGQALISLEPQ